MRCSATTGENATTSEGNNKPKQANVATHLGLQRWWLILLWLVAEGNVGPAVNVEHLYSCDKRSINVSGLARRYQPNP